MRLQHEFTLPIPPAQAWETLLDVRRVAPCMPGATLDHVDGGAFTGRVTLKVGPLRLDYRGEARIAEQDAATRRLVIAARGREARGSGTADATVTATLADSSGGTRVALDTDLALTGRPAQFGRGLIAEVGGGLVGQFARRLAEEMRTGLAAGDLPATPPLPGPVATTPAPVEPGRAKADGATAFDLVALPGPAVAKRLVVVVAAAAVAGAYWLGRRNRRRQFVESGRG